MDVPIKATVMCDDGVAGTSEAVILDPLKRVVTHVVLRERTWAHDERLVPVGLIAWTTEDEIHLRCPLAVARKQEPFLETQFIEVPDDQIDYPLALSYGAAYLWPYAYPHEKAPVTHERVPLDELAIRRGTEVEAADGRVGKVEAFLVDADDDHITHVVVRSGHMVQREFAVPVSDVAAIRDDRIVLGLSRRDVEELPHVPHHEISLLPGIEEADRDLVAVSPKDVGLDQGSSDASHVEVAHLLANEAEQRLESRGFSRDQILEWARQYESAGGNGGVAEFVRWIDGREHARPR